MHDHEIDRSGRSQARIAAPVLASEIACPECGARQTATMPTDACLYFYECRSCGALLKPKAGDCCVFCSYGDVPCPPVQAAALPRPSDPEGW
jgi:hypothetical protein